MAAGSLFRSLSPNVPLFTLVLYCGFVSVFVSVTSLESACLLLVYSCLFPQVMVFLARLSSTH